MKSLVAPASTNQKVPRSMAFVVTLFCEVQPAGSAPPPACVDRMVVCACEIAGMKPIKAAAIAANHLKFNLRAEGFRIEIWLVVEFISCAGWGS